MENKFFQRALKLSEIKESYFLFGPRMTGKSSLISMLKFDSYYDLLDPDQELLYKQNPKKFWDEIKILPKSSVIIVDEIQRCPKLLDYVQMGIQKYQHQFILTGSSARKLKRGFANLLGGRALDLKLHPLIPDEYGDKFTLDQIITFGSLPKILNVLLEKNTKIASLFLKSYITTYIKEEIQAEALTRNIGNFSRFLKIAAQSNAQMIEYSNISRGSGVPQSTVKEYYSILEDTLLGAFLWPLDRSERKKARPKFYFFDTGVVRAIQGNLSSHPLPEEYGFLFETWMIQNFIRLRDYNQKDHIFSLWREDKHEIDLVIESSQGPILAVEFKSGSARYKTESIRAFTRKFPKVKIIIASTDPRSRVIENGIEVHPWRKVLEMYSSLES